MEVSKRYIGGCEELHKVTNEMQKMGYKRSAKKCKEKWENMNKYFKRTIVTGKASLQMVIILDMGLLVAGTKYRGEFEERLKKLMEEIKQSDEILKFLISHNSFLVVTLKD
uniref:Myb/SANT-like DNA-binding domain-containing protein n=1 Tax=Cucumis melo TaxID=3656 RepID=A0A9I9E449_CUCME